MKFKGPQNEYFEIQEINESNCHHLEESQEDVLRLLWFTSDGNEINVDGVKYILNKNQLLSLTQFHNLKYLKINTVNLLRFNREFYCVIDHDSEVNCKGILYYGAAELPIFYAEKMNYDVLRTAWHMSILEFEMKDRLQQEMLQMMLKRILILCTRMYNSQTKSFSNEQHSIIRNFNFLVEQHFKEIHSVSHYADLMNKSAKTISNTFKKLGEKTPLQFVHERIALEARRLLFYTDKDVSEIAYELGFNDIQSFSRFFKKQEGTSPSEFRKQTIV